MRKVGVIFWGLFLICIITACSSGGSAPAGDTFTLKILKEGEGTIVNPNKGIGEYEYQSGTVVTIEINPGTQHIFSEWVGTDGRTVVPSDTANQWKVTMDKNKTIKAVFNRKEYPLNISVKGSGNVQETIISKPSSQNYKVGTTVKLEAESESGWYFDHWEGDITGGETSKQVKVDAEKNITAVFKETSTVEGQVSFHNDTRYTVSAAERKQQTQNLEVNNYEPQSHDKYKKQEIIVKYKNIVSNQSVTSLENKFDVMQLNALNTNDGNLSLYQVPKDKTVQEAVKEFGQKEEVAWAEPNYIYHAMAESNDEYYEDYQWGHLRTNLEAAWDVQKGSNSVTVAVVDSGIIPNHPDLKDNLLQGADFVGGNNNYPVKDYNMTDNDPTDETIKENGGSHGTHCAGIIGAVTNNSIGVAGVNWNVDILPVRALGANGTGSSWDIAEGVYYAVDQGVDVINLSLGGANSSELSQDYVEYAKQNDVVVVAAAGNEGMHPIFYPARYDYTIAVGATDVNNQITDYSNYGPKLDIVAPGGSSSNPIASTWGYYNNGDPVATYKGIQGTSMAAPYVSGIAALLISNGVTSVQEIKDRLKSTAVDLGTSGEDDYYGAGLVDAYGALLDQKLKQPYVFAGHETSDVIEVISEGVQVDSDGNYKLTEVEAKTANIYVWRDVNNNDKFDSGDYWGVSNNSINVSENSNYNVDLDMYYATEEIVNHLKIKGLSH